jgi:pilus assembly protein CpaE
MSSNSGANLPHNIMGFVDDPVSEHIITSAIKEIGIAYSEATRGGIIETIEFLKSNTSPKILMIDISSSELPLTDIIKIKEYTTPNTKIIVIGGKNDVGLFRDLIKIGISDYLMKPINVSLVRKAIEDAQTMVKSMVEKTGKLIYLLSSVGGAGATTIATNIAWILANRHFKRSILMDLDFLFGTVHLMLDIKAENAYVDILESPEKIDDYFVETILKRHSQRLYYLGGLADIVRGVSIDKAAFDALITSVKRQFNYVLVDSQREMNQPQRTCINHADVFVIAVEMSMASAQNAARIMEFLNTDQPGKKILIIANKVGFSSSGALSKDAFEKVIDSKIDYIMTVDEVMTLAAANIGQPLAASNNNLTAILEDIANDLLGKNESLIIEKELLKKEGTTADKIKNIAMDLFEKAMKVVNKSKK